MAVAVKWITPDAERMIVDIARVSSDPNAVHQSDERLLRYLIKNAHWSPFEMASMCVEIFGVSRAVTRQVIRHPSFRFQEFSQRYQDVGVMQQEVLLTEARMQHPTNRQASIESDDEELQAWWEKEQVYVAEVTYRAYKSALEKRIAKEVARVVLPEGMTSTRMFMTGNIRSWLHWCDLRMGNGTQKEHQDLARDVWSRLCQHLPTVTSAFNADGAR